MEKVTVPDRIKNFLRERDNTPYCDDCITEELHLKKRQQAQSVTNAIGGTAGFLRSKGYCFKCSEDKQVTRFDNS